MAYIHKIDALGGALAAIETGYMQQEIQEAAYRYQKAVEKEEQIVVGVNAFEVKETLDLEQLKSRSGDRGRSKSQTGRTACPPRPDQSRGVEIQTGRIRPKPAKI